MTHTSPNDALRFDVNKPRMHLMPPDALMVLAEIYERGAMKYAPRNWERGMHWNRVYDSLMRHALAWQKGEDFDRESGQLHMGHVAWNALTLVAYALRNVGFDDRPLALDSGAPASTGAGNRDQGVCAGECAPLAPPYLVGSLAEQASTDSYKSVLAREAYTASQRLLGEDSGK